MDSSSPQDALPGVMPVRGATATPVVHRPAGVAKSDTAPPSMSVSTGGITTPSLRHVAHLHCRPPTSPTLILASAGISVGDARRPRRRARRLTQGRARRSPRSRRAGHDEHGTITGACEHGNEGAPNTASASMATMSTARAIQDSGAGPSPSPLLLSTRALSSTWTPPLTTLQAPREGGCEREDDEQEPENDEHEDDQEHDDDDGHEDVNQEPDGDDDERKDNDHEPNDNNHEPEDDDPRTHPRTM
ncbi:hypothetical protein BJ912DRAFT_1142185 [Pholiota molesta]|nr:hypothetical protein BJ912DRAFT_1142185 [Pholiota molesta]